MRKYAGILNYSARDQIIYLPAFLVRNIFFVFVIFIFYSLWRVIYSENPVLAGLTITQTLWYLTFTETIELSKTGIMRQIQEEVKDGSIAYSLIRPYSYVLFKIFRSMGESIVKVFPLLAEGFILAWLFTEPLSGYWRALPFGLILITGGLLLNTLWHVTIGLLAFWTEDVSPFYWILQKLIFIVGGMFFPIDFFPEWMQGISKALPFAYSAYWPAYTMVNFSLATFLRGLAGQLAYIAALSLIATALFNLAKRKVHVQGG